MSTPTPPHPAGTTRPSEADDAELAVLGAALLAAGRGVPDLGLDPADFRHPAHEAAWRAVLDLCAAGTPVDVVSVWGALAHGTARVDPALLHRAAEAAPSASAMGHYARLVSDAAARRRLKAAAAQLASLADDPGDVDALLEDARARLDAVTARRATSERVDFIWETVDGTLSRLDDAAPFTPTPWAALNDVIGGWRPGALYVIGARPGVGKSVIGVQAGLGLSAHGGVAMLSLEMTQDDVNRRIIAQAARVPLERLTTAHALSGYDRDRIADWRARNRPPFAVHRSAQVTMTDVRRFARDVHRRAPLAGIVVDYLQLMAQAPGDRRARHEFVAAMSRDLKLLALEMGVPVLMLSQLNRASTTREDKRPALADLRESGAIEQDADVVLLLHRDTLDPAAAHRLEVTVAKNRHGRPGALELEFAGHYSEARG